MNGSESLLSLISVSIIHGLLRDNILCFLRDSATVYWESFVLVICNSCLVELFNLTVNLLRPAKNGVNGHFAVGSHLLDLQDLLLVRSIVIKHKASVVSPCEGAQRFFPNRVQTTYLRVLRMRFILPMKRIFFLIASNLCFLASFISDSNLSWMAAGS